MGKYSYLFSFLTWVDLGGVASPPPSQADMDYRQRKMSIEIGIIILEKHSIIYFNHIECHVEYE